MEKKLDKRQFKNKVEVTSPDWHEPTYTHPFPVLIGNTVETRWSTKLRPIKSLTGFLQSMKLHKNKHYIVEYNKAKGVFVYSFRKGKFATIFALAVGHLAQQPNKEIKVVCPGCGGKFHTYDLGYTV